MATVPFDTLKIAERLERAGFSFDQAKEQAAVLAEIIGAENAHVMERFASKQDFSHELTGIRSSIEKLDTKIDQSVADAKAELVRWVVGVGILQMALIAGIVLKLVHG